MQCTRSQQKSTVARKVPTTPTAYMYNDQLTELQMVSAHAQHVQCMLLLMWVAAPSCGLAFKASKTKQQVKTASGNKSFVFNPLTCMLRWCKPRLFLADSCWRMAFYYYKGNRSCPDGCPVTCHAKHSQPYRTPLPVTVFKMILCHCYDS